MRRSTPVTLPTRAGAGSRRRGHRRDLVATAVARGACGTVAGCRSGRWCRSRGRRRPGGPDARRPPGRRGHRLRSCAGNVDGPYPHRAPVEVAASTEDDLDRRPRGLRAGRRRATSSGLPTTARRRSRGLLGLIRGGRACSAACVRRLRTEPCRRSPSGRDVGPRLLASARRLAARRRRRSARRPARRRRARAVGRRSRRRNARRPLLRSSTATSRSSAPSVRSGPARAPTAARSAAARSRPSARRLAPAARRWPRPRRRARVKRSLVDDGAVVEDVEELVAAGARRRPRPRGSRPPCGFISWVKIWPRIWAYWLARLRASTSSRL